MGRVKLRGTLAVATGLHLALLAALVRERATPFTAPSISRERDLSAEVDVEMEGEPLPSPVVPSPVPAMAGASEGRTTPRTVGLGEPSRAAAKVATTEPSTWTFSAVRSVDVLAARPTIELAPAAPDPPATHILQAALDEADGARGLSPNGPLLAAAHDVVSTSRVPIESSALLTATTDPAGTVIDVRATKGTGDPGAWDEVAASTLDAMRGRRLLVPAGSHGLRIAMKVESRKRRLTGHADSSEPSPVIVTHEAPAHGRAPSVALGTPQYRCEWACTASGNIDPTDALIHASRGSTRQITVRGVASERLP